MFAGQITTASGRIAPASPAPRVALCAVRVKVAVVGAPGSVLLPHSTTAEAPGTESTGSQTPGA